MSKEELDRIEGAIGTLETWFPEYQEGDLRGYPELIGRILASLPGGEDLEDMGYEPFPFIGWQEADMLGKLFAYIRNSSDVAEAARRLFGAGEPPPED